MVSGIDSLRFNQNPYGRIERTGNSVNGRIVYAVTDSGGSTAGRISIPEDEADTFESAYNDIIETAPEIKSYVDANSSPYDINRRKNLSIASVAGAGIIGGVASAITTIGTKSAAKRILGIVTGSLIGLGAGFAFSLFLTTPPGSFRFAKATRTLAGIDIKHVQDESA